MVADDTADQAAEAVDLIVFTPEETACLAADSLFEMNPVAAVQAVLVADDTADQAAETVFTIGDRNDDIVSLTD